MRKHVAILERDPLIAEDITQTVQEVLPNAAIHQVQDLDNLRAVVDAYQGWAWVVLHVPYEQIDVGTADTLRQARAVPVVLDQPHRDDGAQSDWVFLDPPFDAAMLRAALQRTIPLEQG